MNLYGPHKSSIGNIDANIMALLTYGAAIFVIFIPAVSFISWLVPIVICLLEKESSFVKFHAIQAFIINIVGIILKVIISMLIGGSFGLLLFKPLAFGAWGTLIFSGILMGIVSIIIIIFEIVCMAKSYKYEEYEIPIIGRWARKFSSKNQ